jgi:DNA repair exonuclease SbcCD ATPase subunit
MANKKIEVDVIIQSEDSQKKLKDLTKALKQLPTGTEDWKKVYKEIDDLKDRLKGAKQGTDDWVDRLEAAGGPLGMVGAGINKMKVSFSSLDAAFKATGIGLLVSLIAGLVAGFSNSEKATKKLQPLLIGMEKIFNGIYAAVEPLFNSLVDLATKALPYVTQAFGTLYSALTAVFQSLGKLGSAVVKLIKGDFSGAWEDAKESVTKFGDNYEAANNRFIAGTKEVTKTQKEEAAKQLEIALKKLEALKKIQDAELELAKQTALSKAQTEKEKQAVEEEYAQKSYELTRKQLEDRQKLYKKGTNDYKDIQAELIKLDADHIKQVSEDDKKNRELARKKLAEDLDAKIAIEINKENTSQEELKKLLDQRMALELDNVELTEAQKEVIREKYAKQLKDAIKADNDKKKADALKGLADELAAAQGNFDAQIKSFEDFELKSKDIVDLGEKEKADLKKGYQDAILQNLDQSFQAQLTETDEKYGDFKRFDANYYDDLRKSQDDYQGKLKESLEKGAITQVEYNKRNSDLAKARKEIGKQEVASNQEKTKLIGDALGQLSTIVGQDTIAGKAFAIAKATIDTYQSAVAAYKSLAGIPVIGPALGAIAAAAAVASGIATVKKIVSVQIPNAPSSTGGNLTQTTPAGPGERPTISANATAPVGKAQGGLVRGGGGMFSDSIPAMLSDGEFVVNSRSARIFEPLLTSINESGNLPGFAVGGAVSKANRPQQDNTQTLVNAIQQSFGEQPIRTYVTANDISNQQQFDRTIKSRSLI